MSATRQQSRIKGLATAAGLGREGTAVACTLLALLILNVVPHCIDWLERRKQ